MAGDVSLNVRLLSELLASSKAVAVREDLEALANCVPRGTHDALNLVPTEPKTYLTRSEFDSLLTGHGYADAASRADATRAFRDAGVVVLFEDLVYLNGSQVMKDVLRVLPAVPSAVYGLDAATLAELEAELEAVKVDVDAAAARAKAMLSEAKAMLSEAEREKHDVARKTEALDLKIRAQAEKAAEEAAEREAERAAEEAATKFARQETALAWSLCC